MKTMTFAVMIGAVSFGLWSYWGQERPGVDPIVSGSIPSQTVGRSYTISNGAASTACLAERGNPISSRSARFTAGTDCEAVWPGLSKARTWTNNGDGTAVVADAQGEAILTVVDGDGFDYEAVEPAEAMITMVSTD